MVEKVVKFDLMKIWVKFKYCDIFFYKRFEFNSWDNYLVSFKIFLVWMSKCWGFFIGGL